MKYIHFSQIVYTPQVMNLTIKVEDDKVEQTLNQIAADGQRVEVKEIANGHEKFLELANELSIHDLANDFDEYVDFDHHDGELLFTESAFIKVREVQE